jgi:poly(A) polymerase Pap1
MRMFAEPLNSLPKSANEHSIDLQKLCIYHWTRQYCVFGLLHGGGGGGCASSGHTSKIHLLSDHSSYIGLGKAWHILHAVHRPSPIHLL